MEDDGRCERLILHVSRRCLIDGWMVAGHCACGARRPACGQPSLHAPWRSGKPCAMVVGDDRRGPARTPLTSSPPPDGRRMVRVQVGVLFVLACVALLPPQSAGAQDGRPSPSAEELWNSYPLDPSPERGAEPPAVSSPAAGPGSARPTGRAPERSDGGSPIALLTVLAFVAVLGGLALLGFRRLRDIRSQAAAAPLASRPGNGAPVLSASAATPGKHENGPRGPHAAGARGTKDPAATSPQDQVPPREPAGPAAPAAAADVPAGHAPQPEPDVSGSAAAVPADMHRTWMAEIEWRRTDAESRFCVCARAARGEPGTVLAESGPLEWPPTSATSVQALAAAAEKLEASLVAAGWRALPPGSKWYAKRFSWEPVSGESTNSPAAQQHGSGRFARRPPWPEDTRELWRCEIEWEAHSVNSRFRAAVYPPGGRRRRAIGASAAFKSPQNGEPDPHTAEYRAEVRGLTAALEAGGWERAGQGADWFSERFVWRRDGAPSDRVEPVTIEAHQAP